jgi:hypothetical protein
MRFLARLLIVAGALAVAALGLATVQAADQTAPSQGQDQWRYTFHNGQWWYWLPANRWVYWRDNQWNDYGSKTSKAAPSRDAVATTPNSSRVSEESDVRPFYGHALSDFDRRTLEPGSEIGPFYGNALPNEVFGGWRSRSAVRPFHGHAISSRAN